MSIATILIATAIHGGVRSCAVINPIKNQIKVSGVHYSYSLRYRDMGDYIDYGGRVLPAYVINMVEHWNPVPSTTIRRGCGYDIPKRVS